MGFSFDRRFRRIKELSLPDDAAKRRCALACMERNKITRQRKGDSEKKVSQYDDSGPLGSVGQSCPIYVDELFDHLNMHNSASVSMFREDEIERRRKKPDEDQEEHKPSADCLLEMPSCLVPSDVCARCKRRRIRRIEILESLGYAANDKFASMNGKMGGLSICLIWSDFRLWFEIWLVYQSPGKFLGCPIRVIGDNGVEEGAFGEFKVPYSYTVSVMDVFSSHSWGIRDYCVYIDR